MSKERLGEKPEMDLKPKRIEVNSLEAVADFSPGQEYTKKELISLLDTRSPTLNKAITVLRKMAPSFHLEEKDKNWLSEELQALGIYFTLQGSRTEFCLSRLPENLPQQEIERIDEDYQSFNQMAEEVDLSSPYLGQLFRELGLSGEELSQRLPRRFNRANTRRQRILVYPPEFCSFVSSQFRAAEQSNFSYRQWLLDHREEFFGEADRILPDFNKLLSDWLKENVERRKEIELVWRPQKDEKIFLQQVINQTGMIMGGIRARAEGENQEVLERQLHKVSLPSLSEVRLSQEEEKQLAEAAHFSRLAQQVESLAGSNGLYSRLLETGKGAREFLINTNLKLVYFVINKINFNYNRLERNDLFQAGVVGLMKAVEGFDYRRGFRFSTYAVPLIEQSVREEASRNTMLTPYTFRQLVRISEAASEGAEELSDEEISEKVGVSPSVVNKIRTLSNKPISLDARGSFDGRQGYNFLPHSGSFFEGEVLDRMVLAEAIEKTNLTLRQKEILSRRFFEEETLESIGREFDLTRERIRQLEKEALEGLRKNFPQIMSERPDSNR